MAHTASPSATGLHTCHGGPALTPATCCVPCHLTTPCTTHTTPTCQEYPTSAPLPQPPGHCLSTHCCTVHATTLPSFACPASHPLLLPHATLPPTHTYPHTFCLPHTDKQHFASWRTAAARMGAPRTRTLDLQAAYALGWRARASRACNLIAPGTSHTAPRRARARDAHLALGFSAASASDTGAAGPAPTAAIANSLA